MALKPTEHTDGFRKAHETTITLRHAKNGKTYCDEPEALFELLNSCSTWGYEHSIGGAESYWRAQPAAEGTPEPLTEAWYRKEILFEIQRLREMLAQFESPITLSRANMERWIVDALNLGTLLEGAVWRFRFGANIRRDRRQMATLEKGGPVGLATIQANKADRVAELRAKVRAVDQQYPGHSRRWVAGYLIRHDSEEDIDMFRNVSVDALARRITRSTPKRKKSPTSGK